MREIKFRALNPHGGWYFGSLFVNDKGETFIDRSNWQREPVRPETVGQFIGFKDKNGKEIYEGDIVRTKHSHGGETTDVVEIVRDYIVGYFEYLEDGEVIGNIHENPELVK